MSQVMQRTPCAGAILSYFGIENGSTWNNRTKQNVWDNTLRRNGYSVRSRNSKIKPGSTAGSVRNTLANIATDEPQIEAFVVRVQGHVLLMDRLGRTIVDTSPRKRDRRRVLGVLAVWKKI